MRDKLDDPRSLDTCHRVDPDLELPLTVKASISLGLRPRVDARIVDACQAGFKDNRLRGKDASGEIAPGPAWNRRLDQTSSAVDEDAGRPPFGVADDLAVGRGFRIRCHAGPSHRLGVRPARVAIDP